MVGKVDAPPNANMMLPNAMKYPSKDGFGYLTIKDVSLEWL